MSDPPSHVSVLTGDLVRSRSLGPDGIARAFDVLEDCARRQQAWIGASLLFSRHRGDGWQALVTRPALALRAALAFRSALRATDSGHDTYVGIAEGPVADLVGPDLNEETAEVFARSGAALDALKAAGAPVRMAHASGGAIGAATILADHLVRSWTPTQAEAMQHALAPEEPVTYSAIATRLGKSRQAVTKALKAAGLVHLRHALADLEREESR